MGASLAGDGAHVNEIGYGRGASEAPEEQAGTRGASSCSPEQAGHRAQPAGALTHPPGTRRGSRPQRWAFRPFPHVFHCRVPDRHRRGRPVPAYLCRCATGGRGTGGVRHWTGRGMAPGPGPASGMDGRICPAAWPGDVAHPQRPGLRTGWRKYIYCRLCRRHRHTGGLQRRKRGQR